MPFFFWNSDHKVEGVAKNLTNLEKKMGEVKQEDQQQKEDLGNPHIYVIPFLLPESKKTPKDMKQFDRVRNRLANCADSREQSAAIRRKQSSWIDVGLDLYQLARDRILAHHAERFGYSGSTVFFFYQGFDRITYWSESRNPCNLCRIQDPTVTVSDCCGTFICHKCHRSTDGQAFCKDLRPKQMQMRAKCPKLLTAHPFCVVNNCPNTLGDIHFSHTNKKKSHKKFSSPGRKPV